MDQIIFQQIESAHRNITNNLGVWISDHAVHIIIILVVGWLIKKFGSNLIMQLLQKTIRPDLYPTKSDRTKRLKTLQGLTTAILRVTVNILAGFMIIAELGVDTAPLLASAGIIGIAVGFGAQSLIKDLTSGIFIILENQYRVGDVVELNETISGTVKAITIRTTQLRSLDGRLIHIPNGTITLTANKTMSYGGIAEDIVFSRDIDIHKLEIVINNTGKKLLDNEDMAKKIMEAPHFSNVVGFDPNGIKVKILGQTSSDDAAEVKGEFYKLLIKELRKANIKVPYPQITINNSKSPIQNISKNK